MQIAKTIKICISSRCVQCKNIPPTRDPAKMTDQFSKKSDRDEDSAVKNEISGMGILIKVQI
jgi:hypothetical protein